MKDTVIAHRIPLTSMFHPDHRINVSPLSFLWGGSFHAPALQGTDPNTIKNVVWKNYREYCKNHHGIDINEYATSSGIPAEPTLIAMYHQVAKEDQLAKSNPHPIIFDIGASTGAFSLVTTFEKDMKCYSFEPNTELFATFYENVFLNSQEYPWLAENIKLSKNAFWDEKKNMTLNVASKSEWSGLSTFGSDLRRIADRSDILQIEVECITIDDFMETNQIPWVNAIKIDTEGAELNILKGAAKTLIRHMPNLIIEFCQENTEQFGYSTNDILEFLQNIGYHRENGLLIGENLVISHRDQTGSLSKTLRAQAKNNKKLLGGLPLEFVTMPTR